MPNDLLTDAESRHRQHDARENCTKTMHANVELGSTGKTARGGSGRRRTLVRGGGEERNVPEQAERDTTQTRHHY